MDRTNDRTPVLMKEEGLNETVEHNPPSEPESPTHLPASLPTLSNEELGRILLAPDEEMAPSSGNPLKDFRESQGFPLTFP